MGLPLCNAFVQKFQLRWNRLLKYFELLKLLRFESVDTSAHVVKMFLLISRYFRQWHNYLYPLTAVHSLPSLMRIRLCSGTHLYNDLLRTFKRSDFVPATFLLLGSSVLELSQLLSVGQIEPMLHPSRPLSSPRAHHHTCSTPDQARYTI